MKTKEKLERIFLIQNGLFLVSIALKPFLEEWDPNIKTKSRETIVRCWGPAQNMLERLIKQCKVWKDKELKSIRNRRHYKKRKSLLK